MLAPIPFDAPVTTATFPSSFFAMSFAPQPGFATPCRFRCAGRDEGCTATVIGKFARSGRAAESTSAAAALDRAGRADRPRASSGVELTDEIDEVRRRRVEMIRQ